MGLMQYILRQSRASSLRSTRACNLMRLCSFDPRRASCHCVQIYSTSICSCIMDGQPPALSLPGSVDDSLSLQSWRAESDQDLRTFSLLQLARTADESSVQCLADNGQAHVTPRRR